MFRKYLNSREILDKKLVFGPSVLFFSHLRRTFPTVFCRRSFTMNLGCCHEEKPKQQASDMKKKISWRPYENWLEIEDNTTNNSHIWWLPFKVKISTRWKMAQMEKEDKCKQGTRWFQLPAEQTIKIFKTSWLREEDLSDEKIPRA